MINPLDVYWKTGIFGIISAGLTLMIPYMFYRGIKKYPELMTVRLFHVGIPMLIIPVMWWTISGMEGVVDNFVIQKMREMILTVIIPFSLIYVFMPFQDLCYKAVLRGGK